MRAGPACVGGRVSVAAFEAALFIKAEGDIGSVADCDPTGRIFGGCVFSELHIGDQLKVAVFFFCGDGLPGGPGFEHEPPIARDEVWRFFRALPAPEVEAVVERGVAARFVGGLFWGCGVAGEFADADESPFRRGAFAFETDVAFSPTALLAAAHFLLTLFATPLLTSLPFTLSRSTPSFAEMW